MSHNPRVTVAESGRGRYQNDVTIGTMQFIADEPPSVGGDGAGPNPYDFLLAALGSCTNMTVKMYADRKGWPLDRLETHLRHAKVHSEEGSDGGSSTAKVDRIERHVVIDGALDSEQRARLMEIADRCPVHRTLHSQISIVTTAADPKEQSGEAPR